MTLDDTGSCTDMQVYENNNGLCLRVRVPPEIRKQPVDKR